MKRCDHLVVLIQEETGLLLSAASDDIKSRYLGPLLEGDKFGSIGISEPAVGSDIADIRCRARADGDDLLALRSRAYDLTLNGWELGSGSVRIHDPAIQQAVFDRLGIGPDEAQAKFGFLLDAFRYGAPPHAGFAFGIDRLAALLAGEENIREVIAFPKSQSGADPLTNAPTPIADAQLDELGLRVLPPPT